MIKKNKALIFPIKTFNQIQSPEWNMRISNYTPTDGAATTLSGQGPTTGTPGSAAVNFNSQSWGWQIEGYPPQSTFGFWKGDLLSNIGYIKNTDNKPTIDVDGDGKAITKSLNEGIQATKNKRAISQRKDRQSDWNTALHNAATNQMISDNNEYPDIFKYDHTNNMGMICSGGYAEKYTFTSFSNRIPNTELINYKTPYSFNVGNSLYSNETPQYLPFVYNKSHIEVLDTNYSSLNSSTVEENYNDSFKFLQYEQSLNSFTKLNSEITPDTSDYIYDNEIKFTSFPEDKDNKFNL